MISVLFFVIKCYRKAKHGFVSIFQILARRSGKFVGVWKQTSMCISVFSYACVGYASANTLLTNCYTDFGTLFECIVLCFSYRPSVYGNYMCLCWRCCVGQHSNPIHIVIRILAPDLKNLFCILHMESGFKGSFWNILSSSSLKPKRCCFLFCLSFVLFHTSIFSMNISCLICADYFRKPDALDLNGTPCGHIFHGDGWQCVQHSIVKWYFFSFFFRYTY